MDQLAKQFFVFDRAYASGPMTVDSFPGTIAGLHTHNAARYQGDLDWTALPPESSTLVTYLKSYGYNTTAVISNLYLTENQNYDKGFDSFQNLDINDIEKQNEQSGSSLWDLIPLSFDDVTSAVFSKLSTKDNIRNPYMLLYVAYQYRRLMGDSGIHAENMIDQLSQYLENTNTPFFAWTHLMDLHSPLHPEIIDNELSAANSLFEHFTAEGASVADIQYPKLETVYDGALSYVDTQIGRLINWLQDQGYWDNTILIITGDHGQSLYHRGIYGHPRHYLYNDLLHVPLLVRTPERTEVKRIQAQFSLAWLHELLSELLDISQGQFPAASGRKSHLEDLSDDAIVLSDSINEFGHTVTAQNSKYKYMTHFGSQPEEKYQIMKDTNYRIKSDPGERHPLSGNEGPQELRRLAKEVRTDPSDLPTIEHQVSKEVENRLEELGYTT